MQNAVERAALACVRNGNSFSAGSDEKPGVTWLAATQRVENGAVQFETSFMDLYHRRRSGLQVGVVAKQ